MGGCSIDAYGVPLSDEGLKIAKKSDSVLLGYWWKYDNFAMV